jgi:hypothetical protein
MTDAALGGLSGEREAELRAHVSRCETCRGEWEATSALVAAVDRSLATLVDGEPSPQFTARLRARIAEEPAPAAWPVLTWPRIAAAGLVASVALVVVLMTRGPDRAGPAARIAANPTAAAEQPHARESNAAPERVAAKPDVASRRDRARVRGRSGSLSFEVLVPKGQISAALLLSEGVSAGTIDGAQLVELVRRSAEPLEVKALDIEPLAAPSAGENAPAASDSDGRF